MVARETPSQAANSSEQSLLGYIFIGLLGAVLLMAAWTARELRVVRNTLASLVSIVAVPATTEDVFVDSDAWGMGDAPPNIPLLTLSGSRQDFPNVVNEYNVIYVAWDECSVCNRHFDSLETLNSAAAEAGGSFAVVIYLTGETLDEFASRFQWSFPLFEVPADRLADLNIHGTPTLLIFRNGALVHALAGSGLSEMVVATVRTPNQTL